MTTMNTRHIKPLAWLPNQKGFSFIGVKHDDSLVQCVVCQNEDGGHYVGGDANFKELKGWKLK